MLRLARCSAYPESHTINLTQQGFLQDRDGKYRFVLRYFYTEWNCAPLWKTFYIARSATTRLPAIQLLLRFDEDQQRFVLHHYQEPNLTVFALKFNREAVKAVQTFDLSKTWDRLRALWLLARYVTL